MFRFRIKVLLVVFVFTILILFGRLSFLQIFKGNSIKDQVRRTNIIEKRIDPIRGSIVDRNGIALAEEVPSFNIYFDPLKFPFEDNSFILEIKKFHKNTAKKSRAIKRKLGSLLIDRLSKEVRIALSDRALKKFHSVIQIPPNEVFKRFVRIYTFAIKRWIPEPLLFNLSFEEAILLEIEYNGVKGLKVATQTIRSYPEGNSCAHLVGQIQHLSEDEVGYLTKNGYFNQNQRMLINLTNEEHQYLLSKHELSNLWVGRTGLEFQYNKLMRGQSGEQCLERILIKNSDGEVSPEYIMLYEIPPKLGRNIKLTIDIELQKIVEEEMRKSFKSTISEREFQRKQVGAFVALNPHTGEILAMSSVPDFNPNDLIPPINSDVVDDVILGIRRPNYIKGLNRGIRGHYPPGSPFKMFVALMALEDKIITDKSRFTCSGSLQLGTGRPFKCHSNFGHQRLNIYKALKKSCNIFFYHLGLKLKTRRQIFWSKQFGFGQKTGIDLPGEYRGNLPKIKYSGTGREISNKYVDSHFSIGQVDLEVTPLQMARGISIFANGGYLVYPHLKRRRKVKRKNLNLNQKNIDIVVEGMFKVVNEPGGTAYRKGRLNNIIMIGKTGTADIGGFPVRAKPKWQDPLYRYSQKSYEPHAWFVGFAPRSNPVISFACISEYSGHGGDIAAPIVKRILERYFKVLKIREDKKPKG
ncbi:MAG: hypothetical protein COA79_11565 [Planctomycetota bacterium]|nr:MAG: hypothetical protein COA79_11565 [Planctomycetota bacterium]